MDGPSARAAAPTPQPDWVRRRALDVDEYHRMGEAGILGREDRVELIEGELIAMSPVGVPHINRLNALNRRLVMAVADRAIVSVQNPVRLNRFSEPQPDFALLRPGYPDGATTPPLPADVLLLIELSDSTLRYDRQVKAALYARNGIVEYWVLDLQGQAVILHREPGEDGYAVTRQALPDEVLEPVRLPGLALPVAQLLA